MLVLMTLLLALLLGVAIGFLVRRDYALGPRWVVLAAFLCVVGLGAVFYGNAGIQRSLSRASWPARLPWTSMRTMITSCSSALYWSSGSMAAAR